MSTPDAVPEQEHLRPAGLPVDGDIVVAMPYLCGRWTQAAATPFADLRCGQQLLGEYTLKPAAAVLIPAPVAEALVRHPSFRQWLAYHHDGHPLPADPPDLAVLPARLFGMAVVVQHDPADDTVWLGTAGAWWAP